MNKLVVFCSKFGINLLSAICNHLRNPIIVIDLILYSQQKDDSCFYIVNRNPQ